MSHVPTIKDVFTAYSHNPEALLACREVMAIVEASVETIVQSAKTRAGRSEAIKATGKEPITPTEPLSSLI